MMSYKEDLLHRVAESIIRLEANTERTAKAIEDTAQLNNSSAERIARVIEENAKINLSMKDSNKTLNDTLMYHIKEVESKFDSLKLGCHNLNMEKDKEQKERERRQHDREKRLWQGLAIVCGVLLFILLILAGLEKVIPMLIKYGVLKT